MWGYCFYSIQNLPLFKYLNKDILNKDILLQLFQSGAPLQFLMWVYKCITPVGGDKNKIFFFTEGYLCHETKNVYFLKLIQTRCFPTFIFLTHVNKTTVCLFPGNIYYKNICNCGTCLLFKLHNTYIWHIMSNFCFK